MVETALSIAFTVGVIHIHSHGSQTPVPWVIKRIFFRIVARVLCMGSLTRDLGQECVQVKDLSATKGEKEMKVEEFTDADDHTRACYKDHTAAMYLNEIASHLRTIIKKIEVKEKEESITEEWKILAQILDRLFFWITLTAFIVATIALILHGYAHHIFPFSLRDIVHQYFTRTN